MFQICRKCGRYAAYDDKALAEMPDDAAERAAVDEFLGEGHDLLTFTEQPQGWPLAVEGVATNGHRMGRFGTQRRCVRDGEAWPCAEYVAMATDCPGSRLDQL